MFRQRPHVEATALLGAMGFATAPVTLSTDPETDMRHPRYALLTRLTTTEQPQPFDSLADLAAHIQKSRFGQGLQLREVEGFRQQIFEQGGRRLHLSRGRDRAVQVWTTMLDGGLDRSLGFAWLNGGGREDLQRALSAAVQKAAA